MKSAWKHNAWAISSLLWLSTLVVIANVWCMAWLGEKESLSTSVERQMDSNGLWNMVSQPVSEYKVIAYSRINPEIVAVGSSRSLQFRDYFFEKTFYNAGGTVLAPSQFRFYLAQLFKKHKPRVVIYPLDFWLFCDNRFAYDADENGGDRPITRSIMKFPTQAIQNGMISTKDYFELISKIGSKSHSLGFLAESHRVGFGPDGSIYNFKILNSEAQRNVRLRWQEVYKRIVRSENQFVDSCASPEEAISHIEGIRNELATQNVKLVFLAPPMPPHIATLMERTGRYGYVKGWRDAMKKRFPDFIDLHDAAQYGAQNCEFTDGFHAGEVATMRSLIRAAEEDRDFASLLNLPLLKDLVKYHPGQTVVANNSVGQNFADFLAKQSSPETRCVEEI
jgi:hypothetical protein